MRGLIKKGTKLYSVFNNLCPKCQSSKFWPENNPYKDINDMILGGISPEDIMEQIKENTCRGAEARLRFAEWRKINA